MIKSRKDDELAKSDNVIEIRVNQIAQLFHTLDPFPFREKDLDREAEEYIVGWARELPRNRPFGSLSIFRMMKHKWEWLKIFRKPLADTSQAGRLSFRGI